MAGPHHHTQGFLPWVDEATAPALTATPVTLSTKVDTRPTTLHSPILRIKCPTFDGDPLSWDSFYKLFESIMADTSFLSDHQRTTMLIEAMLDSHARTIAETATADGTYESTLRALTDAYGRPRVIFPLHLGNIATSITKPIACTFDSMLEVKSLLFKTYRGLQACKLCTAEHILEQLAFKSLTAGSVPSVQGIRRSDSQTTG